jgi:hypothetical protein
MSVSAYNTSTKVNTEKTLNNSVKIVDTDNEKFEKIKSGLFDFETDLIWYIVLQIMLLHTIGIYGLLTFNYMKNAMTTLSKYIRLKNFIMYIEIF